eukprot:jgi/Mesvir1/21881/Mv01950-RA.1
MGGFALQGLAASASTSQILSKPSTTSCCPRLGQRDAISGIKLRSQFTQRKPLSPFPAQHTSVTARSNLSVNIATVADTETRQLSSDTHPIGEGQAMTVTINQNSSNYTVEITQNQGPMLLHWAVDGWKLAPKEAWPAGTKQMDEKAVQTPFQQEGGLWKIKLVFPEKVAPKKVVFVLKVTDSYWINAGGGDFAAKIVPAGSNELLDKIIEAETTWGNFSLFGRFQLARDFSYDAEQAGPEGMAIILVWLRFSANRKLAWYRGQNYQSKDIAHVQKVLTERMAELMRGAADTRVRPLARMAAATLPRGGGDSEQIRMGILQIMRENGIKEGHRPGLEERFLEEWHQKLHTNTTPEDIAICAAYLDFLHTGQHSTFWDHLWYNHGISKDYLATMDHPIKSWPMHLPHLIPAFKHFLWVLKTVHAGADLDVMMEMSKGFLDDGLKGTIYNVLNNRNEWWVPGEIVKARQGLEHVWRSPSSSRDVVLLDIALDNYFGVCVNRVEKSSLDGNALVDLIVLVLSNTVLHAESEDLWHCLCFWHKVNSQERWTKEWAKLAWAALDRTQISLEDYMDSIYRVVQPPAEALGRAANIEESYITNFGEEVVRGQSAFNLSPLLSRLEPMLREAAGMGSWQVVSQVATAGEAVVVASLADIQGKDYPSPVILFTKQVGGMEDIPTGVVGVITTSNVDVLSHVAIRARNQKVLLATCHDDSEFDKLLRFEGKKVAAFVDPTGAVDVTDDSSAVKAYGGVSVNESLPPVSGSAPKESDQWVLREGALLAGNEGVVGGKSRNLATMKKALGGAVKGPSCVVVPFGVFERVLAEDANKGVASLVANHVAKAEAGDLSALDKVRAAIRKQLVCPAPLRQAVVDAVGAELLPGGVGSDAKGWAALWDAITGVWASKWTERAWLSRRARGMTDNDLRMAVLLQRVVPARYAFVLHTANPITGDRNEVFGEVVVGLGEVLVGNSPGRALSFTIPKAGSSAANILSLPTKRVGLFATHDTLIARSDSNGEDLEAFAGAGL